MEVGDSASVWRVWVARRRRIEFSSLVFIEIRIKDPVPYYHSRPQIRCLCCSGKASAGCLKSFTTTVGYLRSIRSSHLSGVSRRILLPCTAVDSFSDSSSRPTNFLNWCRKALLRCIDINFSSASSARSTVLARPSNDFCRQGISPPSRIIENLREASLLASRLDQLSGSRRDHRMTKLCQASKATWVWSIIVSGWAFHGPSNFVDLKPLWPSIRGTTIRALLSRFTFCASAGPLMFMDSKLLWLWTIYVLLNFRDPNVICSNENRSISSYKTFHNNLLL
ncbi:PREDICTED: uncharacterized protein LOC104702849 [Camelina sativa]|uniref:Uncharacterized protein LOC104702849 n=1 Tax=Camelina sativa TaxID=90675 RepID=A0ABM0SWB9_CAMSA|nr:PREDICTED: uncharacterized protein LOC104702849 [Camelina sativa]